jgi:hypothetical protein
MGAATSQGELSGGNYYFAGGGNGFTGATMTYALGGGGGANRASANGTANTGGGGGALNSSGTNGNGGSGIVIFRTSGTYTAASTTGSPTRVVSGGYTYYYWTGNGGITI